MIADIHSNKPALQAVLGALDGLDMIYCIGDLTGYYTDPNGVISMLLEHHVDFIIGNHDWYLRNPPRQPSQLLHQSIEFTLSQILPEYRQLLTDSPSQMQFRLGGVLISMYHGSPWDTLEEYVYPNYPHFENFADMDADTIILGHTHYPMVRNINSRLLVNPGSCGQPRDEDWRASCAVLDTNTLDVEIIRVKYDISQVVDSVYTFGLDRDFSDALLKHYPRGIVADKDQKYSA